MNILIIGGTGFIGAAITRQLSVAGHRLRLATRRRERSKHLTTLPTVELVEANVHDTTALSKLMLGQDAIISMVGILHGNFKQAHAELPAKIAAAAQVAGIRRIVHISALGAAANAPSDYLRSKAAGELSLKQCGLDVTVLQPSVVFGQGDRFLNLFAAIQKFTPILPLACPQAQFQPVWVEDVAATVVACLHAAASIGQTYTLGGPAQYTLHELVSYAGRTAGHRARIIDLPAPLSYLQALVMGLIPGSPMTLDNYRSMQVPNICQQIPALPFGLTATALETIAPQYLRNERWCASNDRFREHARR